MFGKKSKIIDNWKQSH